MLRLVIEDDEGKQTVVPLIRDEITIGRQEGNTIRLTERNVSRHHARLLRMGNADDITVIVEDLDSYNGIKINGERVTQKCTMRPGDLIQIGDYALQLQTDRPATRAEPADSGTPTVVARTDAPADDAPTALHRVDLPDQLTPEQSGRLVVVSSNLAGQSYDLDRREIIIGRTDENDVVVNHRSISRNHAKIIHREGGFTIFDLGSSNGVKVNGEDFGTSTLVSGDIIELGHVRLRFVAPGEEYVFTPADLEDVENVEAAPGTGRLILIGLGLVAVAVAAFFLVRGSDPVRPGLPVAPPTGETARAASEEAPPVDVNALMAEGRTHVEKEQWTEAANVFGRVLQSQKDNPEARELRNKANREADNQRKFNTIRQQVDDHQWAEAWFAVEDFPADSLYFPRLADLRPALEKGYADAELERAKALIAEGRSDAAREVHAALDKRPFAKAQADAIAAALVKAAAPPSVAAARPPEHVPPRPRPPREEPAPPVAPPPDTAAQDAEYDDLMKRSLALIAKGQRAEAADLLERARRLKPEAKPPHQRLCAIYKPLGKLDKALFHCKKWLALEKNGSYRPAIERTIQQIEAEIGQ